MWPLGLLFQLLITNSIHEILHYATTYCTIISWYFLTLNFTSISGIFKVPKYLCAAMYLKGVFTFSEQKKFGTLTELHIVDLTSDVLDLVKENYQTYLSKENTLDPKRLLAIHDREEKTKLDKDAHTQNVCQTHTNDKSTDQIQKSSITGYLVKGCFTKTINNVRVYVYTHDIGFLKDIDVIVSSENPYFTGKGGIAATLLATGGEEYAKEHEKLRRTAPHTRFTTKLTPGFKTNFKGICHAVVVAFSRTNPLSKDCHDQYTRFITDILNKLNIITEQSVKYKHKEGFCSIVLPLLGAGNYSQNFIIMPFFFFFEMIVLIINIEFFFNSKVNSKIQPQSRCSVH